MENLIAVLVGVTLILTLDLGVVLLLWSMDVRRLKALEEEVHVSRADRAELRKDLIELDERYAAHLHDEHGWQKVEEGQ